MDGLWYVGYGIYLADRIRARDKQLLKDHKITHKLTLGKENAPEDKRDNSDPNHLVIDMGDGFNEDWDPVFKDKDTLAFLKRYFASKGTRLLVNCSVGMVRSPFAVRCILIKYCNFTPFMAQYLEYWLHSCASAA